MKLSNFMKKMRDAKDGGKSYKFNCDIRVRKIFVISKLMKFIRWDSLNSLHSSNTYSALDLDRNHILCGTKRIIRNPDLELFSNRLIFLKIEYT